MPVVILIAGRADGQPCHCMGEYIEAMDFEAYNGRGVLKTTPHRECAMKFVDNGEAFAFWTTVPKCIPKRPDGKPNKPLTAYTVLIEEG